MITTAHAPALRTVRAPAPGRRPATDGRRWIGRILAGTLAISVAVPALAIDVASASVAVSSGTTASQPELHPAGGGLWGG